jgi:cysteine desulfurase
MGDQSNAPIYLDHNATTPLDDTAMRAMIPHMEEEYGNPSSSYALGSRAKEAVEQARLQVASLLGCSDEEIIFTSGGSESNNMVLKGIIDLKRPGDFHMITSSVEHPAILNPALYLMELGVDVTILPVDRMGLVDPDGVRKAVTKKTALITIMMANNETGTLQPIREIGDIAKAYGIPFHTDAAQAVGKISVRVEDLGVDFLSVAGHKLYGPKGVGALFTKKGTVLTPLIHGAGQEMGKRAGTENIIFSVGLGAACSVAEDRLDQDIKDMTFLRDKLQELLFREIDGLVLNGHPHERLPNTLNVSVPKLEGSRILEGLPNLMASTGAACHDRSVKLSHVLSAMAVSPDVGMGTLRLAVGRSNTMGQIETAARMLIDQVRALRQAQGFRSIPLSA